MSRYVRVIATTLATSILLVIVLAAGRSGLLYAGLYALALVPGLPLGFWLFGREHAAGWVAGGAFGYFLTTIALWSAIALEVPSTLAFLSAWALMCAIAWIVTARRDVPLLALPAWTRRDTTALLLVLLMVPALAGPPFSRLGARDRDGNRYYRAYFTADFVWHMAVTSEVKKFAMPPRNPFMPLRPLHYYWGYYVIPAAISSAGPGLLSSVENNLKVNAIGTAFLLVSATFVTAWLAVPRAEPVAGAVALVVLASSAEGLYAIGRLLRRGVSLAALRDLNIDAITNWWFGGLRVDGLPRCFWYVPQHSASYALGLTALAVQNAAGSSGPIAVHALAGIALAGSVAFNPFVGGLFSLAWGIGIAVDAIRAGQPLRRLACCSVAAIPVLAALAWCLGTQMVGGAPGLLEFGLRGDARHAPLWNLMLSLGPVLIPAGLGLLGVRAARLRANIVAVTALAAIALLVLYLVRLRVDTSWVGFRAGQIFLVTSPALIASGLAANSWRRVTVPVAALAFCVGLPTTLVDVYNAQDISNLSPGPGFPWTQVLDRPHQDALDWLRRTTPATATVQLDTVARGSTTWSIIPSFAERRMAAGLPRTLVDDPEYHERSARVAMMFASPDADEAWTIAHALRINYVYVDDTERTTYPSGIGKFDMAPELFAPVFRNAEVTIYHVQ